MRIGMGIGIGVGGGSSLGISDVSPSTLVGWYRADFGINQAGTGVSEWAPKFGSTTWTQSTDADRPTFEAAGLNGQPSVLFVLANTDQMAGTGALASVLNGADTPVTVIMAVQMISLAAVAQTLIGWGRSTDANPLYHFQVLSADNVRVQIRDDAASLVSSSTTQTVTTNPMLMSYVHTGIAVSAFFDGAATSLANTAQNIGTKTIDQCTLGSQRAVSSSNFADYRLAEVAVWSSALSTADRLAAEALMRARYGTP